MWTWSKASPVSRFWDIVLRVYVFSLLRAENDLSHSHDATGRPANIYSWRGQCLETAALLAWYTVAFHLEILAKQDCFHSVTYSANDTPTSVPQHAKRVAMIGVTGMIHKMWQRILAICCVSLPLCWAQQQNPVEQFAVLRRIVIAALVADDQGMVLWCWSYNTLLQVPNEPPTDVVAAHMPCASQQGLLLLRQVASTFVPLCMVLLHRVSSLL